MCLYILTVGLLAFCLYPDVTWPVTVTEVNDWLLGFTYAKWLNFPPSLFKVSIRPLTVTPILSLTPSKYFMSNCLDIFFSPKVTSIFWLPLFVTVVGSINRFKSNSAFKSFLPCTYSLNVYLIFLSSFTSPTAITCPSVLFISGTLRSVEIPCVSTLLLNVKSK